MVEAVVWKDRRPSGTSAGYQASGAAFAARTGAAPSAGDRLEEGLNRGLVLVAAPAGYGKSVLLSEWVRGMTEPVAWLSLDGGDNDPVRFWRHVLAALDMVRPGIAERVSPLAGPPAPPSYDALVSALINESRPSRTSPTCCWCSTTTT
jgi:ATP-dependent transcriptional regulator